MRRFKIKPDTAKHVLLYILYKFTDFENIKEVDGTDIMSIIFLSDRDHLVKYGRPITGDVYSKLFNSPVPSFIFAYYMKIEVEDVKTYDTDYISKSGLDIINKWIDVFQNSPKDKLSRIIEDISKMDGYIYDYMDIEKMALSGGATNEMIRQIGINMDTDEINLK